MLKYFFIAMLLSVPIIGQQKNILFIAIDDLKPLIGAYGDEIAITPNIDQLANVGTTFLNNHCQQAVCAPSRASILTGLRPDRTKVWDLQTVMRDFVPDIVTLPQYLITKGYETAGTGKIFDPRSVDSDLDAPSWSIPFSKVSGNKWLEPGHGTGDGEQQVATEISDNPEEDFIDAKIVNQGISLLEILSAGDKPFFLGVGFKKPHLPFVAPDEFWDKYDRDQFVKNPIEVQAENGLSFAYSSGNEFRNYDDITDSGIIPEEEQKRAIHGYYACVSHIDSLVGVLLKKLDDLGERDNTVIVLWGDHGWHLGDHNQWAKHSNFEQATRSPLIISSSEITGNNKSNSPTEFIDVFPTLCDLANVETPTNIDGVSLKPIMNNPNTLVKDFAMSQYHRQDSGHQLEGYAMRTKQFRYVEWIDGKFKSDVPYDEENIYKRELYDYYIDSLETRNRIDDAEYQTIVEDLHQKMIEFFENDTSAGGSDTTSNLLRNPGFEEGLDTNDVTWWLSQFGGAVGSAATTTDAIEGDSAVVITVTTAGSNIANIGLISDSVKVFPSGELTLTAKVKTSSDGLPFRLSMKSYNEDLEVKYYSGDEVTLTTNYETYTWKVTPKPDYSYALLVRLQCGKEVGEYYFDDIRLFGETQESIIPDGRRLREIVADKYPSGNLYIGGTTQGPYWGTFSEEILNNEFSYITPANDFKQSYIHPEPGVYRWTDSDTWVQKAKANNQVVRMHSPISPQCSKWAKDDSRTGEELLQNLEEYMIALCQHYNDEENILWMDVVNETIDKTTGEWFGPKPGTDKWENPWTIIGFDTTDDGFNPPLYIDRAFELANEHAPDIKQIINNHGGMNDAAWDKIKAMVTYLRGKGRRVDGIGFQCHVDVGWENEVNDNGVNNIEALGNLIDWAHTNNLEFHVTENNVYLRNGNEGKWDEQAETFKVITEMVISKRTTGLVSWNAWMLRDNLGQAGDRTPTLFRENGTAKPAYYAVQSVLEDSITTSIAKAKPVPESFKLFQNYPNPFNPSTKIKFSIPKTGVYSLKVYSILGQEVSVLVNKNLSVGNYIFNFDASKLSSGIYFYKLVGDNVNLSKKMLLLK